MLLHRFSAAWSSLQFFGALGLVILMMAPRIAAQEGGNISQNTEAICTYDLSSLYESKNFREVVTRLAKEEAEEHGLGAKHVEELMQELKDYRILVIDSVRTILADGIERKEFAHENAPKVVLYRTTGEHVPRADKPLAEQVIPQLTASVEMQWQVKVVSKESKEFFVTLHVYGLSGTGWRESTQKHRWGTTDMPTLKIMADGRSSMGFWKK